MRQTDRQLAASRWRRLRLLTVVRGEAVDDVQVLPQRLHVLAGAQHGPHLRPAAADVGHVLLAQEKVVRRHFARHLDALLLGRPDDQDLLLFGHVADVDGPLVQLSHHQDGGHRLLLGVGHDGQVLGPLLKVLRIQTRDVEE